MKIIARGVPPSDREWRLTCAACRTIFECLQSEGIYNYDQRDGEYLVANCPVCEKSCYGRLK